MTAFIYLASKSPRRQELLSQIGVEFRMLVPNDDEDAESLEAFSAGESPADYVHRVVMAKLDAAMARLRSRGLPWAPVLAADTTVALGGTLLAKPADAADAARMLRLLSGRTHRVLTGVAVHDGRRAEFANSISRVRFTRLTSSDIDSYVASGEPFDKAGGYGIQGLAGAFVRRIEGSYSGIMGLPVFETARLVRGALRRRSDSSTVSP